MDEYVRLRAIEEATREQAGWFGNTGLDEDMERELPRYLRREFGEFMHDEGSLQAAHLTYLGAFDEPDARVHYWRVPASSAEPVFAYVETDGDDTICIGWGNREPPAGGQRVP